MKSFKAHTKNIGEYLADAYIGEKFQSKKELQN